MSNERTQPLPEDIVACLQRALDEDVGSGDATTDRIVPADATLNAQIIAKQDGIVAGLDVAENVFRLLDEQIRFQPHTPEGSVVASGFVLADVSLPAAGGMFDHIHLYASLVHY